MRCCKLRHITWRWWATTEILLGTGVVVAANGHHSVAVARVLQLLAAYL